MVVLARRSGQAWLFGPNAQAAVVGPLPADQAQRMLQSALDEPSGLAARQRLAGMYAAIDGTKPGAETDYLPGVANAGLFATHELRHGVRERSDWSSACGTAEPLLALMREALIEALGYTAQSVGAHALILLAEGVTSRAVAVLLDETESFDGDSIRFSVSPVAYAVSIELLARALVAEQPAQGVAAPARRSGVPAGVLLLALLSITRPGCTPKATYPPPGVDTFQPARHGQHSTGADIPNHRTHSSTVRESNELGSARGAPSVSSSLVCRGGSPERDRSRARTSRTWWRFASQTGANLALRNADRDNRHEHIVPIGTSARAVITSPRTMRKDASDGR